MKTYLLNLKLFLTGFARFSELSFKPGWSATSPGWWLLYTFDYGTHVLTGAACVSWSRWAWDYREKYGLAEWLNRLLGERHTSDAGPALWGTVDSDWRVRVGVTLAWLIPIGSALYA